MTKQKQTALIRYFGVKQYKLYDWLNINLKKDKLIPEKHQDPLENTEKSVFCIIFKKKTFFLVKKMVLYSV